MKKSPVRLVALLSALSATAAGAQIVPPAPPLPMIHMPPLGQQTQMLQRWMPGDVRCDGAASIPASLVRRPWTSLNWGSVMPAPIDYAFRIDDSGRPLSIVRASKEYAQGDDDVAPSLAATRFAAGAAQTGCRISYRAERFAFADAPRDDLISYTVNPMSGQLPEAGWKRIRPANATCGTEPRAQWLVNVTPDFTKMRGQPGVRDWTLVGYDLDARGKPVKVHHVTGTGNGELDRAGIAAMAKSRMTDGARTGCLNPYWRNAARFAAPPTTDPEPLRSKDATCTQNGDWVTKPVLTFPEAWRKRAIEGWAVVAFDVAPWGATGNLRVVASEPADAFGERAVQILRYATKAASPSGVTGCIERVRFVMGPGVPEPTME